MPAASASRNSPSLGRRAGGRAGSAPAARRASALHFLSPSRCWRLRTINSKARQPPNRTRTQRRKVPRRSPRRAVGRPAARQVTAARGAGGLIPLARVLFPCFPAGSGASGEIKSRESVPPKSLPFIPLSSFLRLQPARRAQPWQKAKALSSGAAAARRGGDPAGSSAEGRPPLSRLRGGRRAPPQGPGLREREAARPP